jgi:putative ABC transport system permease protein
VSDRPEGRSPGARPVARALHRIALYAYPRAFRREFGPELQRIFQDRLTAALRQSRRRARLAAAYHLADAVLSGLAERVSAVAASGPRRAYPVPTVRRLPMVWDSFVADLRLALRRFREAPLFALLTVSSLALGIGANSAIFSVVDAVLLRPLPYASPDSLVTIWSHNTRQSEPQNPVSPADFQGFRAAPALASAEAMYSFLIPVPVGTTGDPDIAQAAVITPGMFALLGRSPLLGRTFRDGDPDASVVLSHEYWRRRFGQDAAIVGRTIAIAGVAGPVTILGVMPDDFVFPYRSMLGPSGFTRATEADLWLPLTPTADARLVDATGQPNRTIHYLAVIGRLAPSAALDRATRDLASVALGRAGQFPDTNTGWGVTVRALHEQTVGPMRAALLTLAGGVGIVLLITCINVANVLLARATGRQREMAIRSALGASNRRLIQQTLAESALLAAMGGLLGLGLLGLVTRAMLALAPPNMPRLGEVAVNLTVVLFALGTSGLTGLAVGVLPGLSGARSDLHDGLREGRRTTMSAARRRIRATLVVTEVAVAMVLTVGAGLLLRSFVTVLDVDPGFQTDHLLTLQISLPARLQDPAARLTFFDDLEARLRALPGVTQVGGTTRLPLGSMNLSTVVEVEGRVLPRAEWPEVEMRRAVFDYFGTMKIPLQRGRTFTPSDGPSSTSVGVVNGVFAARVFPNEDPIGRRIRLGGPAGSWTTIVGVVGSIKHGSLEEMPRPELYMSYRQTPPVAPFLVIRTLGDPVAIAGAARDAVRTLGALPPTAVSTMEQIRSNSLEERRFVLLLVSVFGVLALVLAAVGVYGVIALLTAERTAEVAIRLALGATPTDVLGLIVAQTLKLTLAGVAIGAALAAVLSPALASQLFGVAGRDPATYAGVACALVGVAVSAALVPARRAMRVDPAVTLQH